MFTVLRLIFRVGGSPLDKCCLYANTYIVFHTNTSVDATSWSFGFFIPAPTANDLRLWRIFNPRFYPFSYLNSWERASILPSECSVLNKGTPGTIFITSLVWRGPWLRIEPGTSRTRSQHYTTRLSRRRLNATEFCINGCIL